MSDKQNWKYDIQIQDMSNKLTQLDDGVDPVSDKVYQEALDYIAREEDPELLKLLDQFNKYEVKDDPEIQVETLSKNMDEKDPEVLKLLNKYLNLKIVDHNQSLIHSESTTPTLQSDVSSVVLPIEEESREEKKNRIKNQLRNELEKKRKMRLGETELPEISKQIRMTQQYKDMKKKFEHLDNIHDNLANTIDDKITSGNLDHAQKITNKLIEDGTLLELDMMYEDFKDAMVNNNTEEVIIIFKDAFEKYENIENKEVQQILSDFLNDFNDYISDEQELDEIEDLLVKSEHEPVIPPPLPTEEQIEQIRKQRLQLSEKEEIPQQKASKNIDTKQQVKKKKDANLDILLRKAMKQRAIKLRRQSSMNTDSDSESDSDISWGGSKKGGGKHKQKSKKTITLKELKNLYNYIVKGPQQPELRKLTTLEKNRIIQKEVNKCEEQHKKCLKEAKLPDIDRKRYLKTNKSLLYKGGTSNPFSYIHHPKTGKKYNINTSEGKNLLKNYIKQLLH